MWPDRTVLHTRLHTVPVSNSGQTEATDFGEIMQNNGQLRRSRSFKVTDFDTKAEAKAHMGLPIGD